MVGAVWLARLRLVVAYETQVTHRSRINLILCMEKAILKNERFYGKGRQSVHIYKRYENL